MRIDRSDLAALSAALQRINETERTIASGYRRRRDSYSARKRARSPSGAAPIPRQPDADAKTVTPTEIAAISGPFTRICHWLEGYGVAPEPEEIPLRLARLRRRMIEFALNDLELLFDALDAVEGCVEIIAMPREELERLAADLDREARELERVHGDSVLGVDIRRPVEQTLDDAGRAFLAKLREALAGGEEPHPILGLLNVDAAIAVAADAKGGPLDLHELYELLVERWPANSAYQDFVARMIGEDFAK